MKFVGRRRSAKPFRTWLKNLCFYKSGSFEYLLACLFVCLFVSVYFMLVEVTC